MHYLNEAIKLGYFPLRRYAREKLILPPLLTKELIFVVINLSNVQKHPITGIA